MERRLAAIMATDVVGYSRLIRADEEGMLAALNALRADLFDPKIAEYHGRIVKLMSDGILAEFLSVVDAVHTTTEVQHDIHGDGANIAARLERIAEPTTPEAPPNIGE